MIFYFIARDFSESWAMFFYVMGALLKNNVRNENFYIKNLSFLIGKVYIFALEMNIILLKRVRVG